MKLEVQVSDLEEDVLKEVIGIGLAKVADSFAVLARQPVLLHVPDIRVVTAEELDAVLPDNQREDSVVQSDLKGDLNAKTFLIYKLLQANRLSEICLGPEKLFEGNYNAMRRSLLLETSNILTGAMVTQFANIFQMDIYGTPPVAVPYRLRKTFADLIANLILFKPFVLTVKTEFLNIGKVVELPMVIVFDINSMFKVLTIIRKRNKMDPNWLAHQ